MSAVTLELPSLTDQLRGVVTKIEALEQEKADVAAALKEAFEEAKQEGLDVKALRELLKLRKQDPGQFEEQRSTLVEYMQAMGMMPR